jgi:hypothetical protein
MSGKAFDALEHKANATFAGIVTTIGSAANRSGISAGRILKDPLISI